MSASVSDILSNLMESPGVVLRKDISLIDEMDAEPGHSMWDHPAL